MKYDADHPFWKHHGKHVPVSVAGHVICDVCLLFLLPGEYRADKVTVSDRRFRSKLLGFGREFAGNIPMPPR